MAQRSLSRGLLDNLVRECSERPVLEHALRDRVIDLYAENRAQNKRLSPLNGVDVDDAIQRAVDQRITSAIKIVSGDHEWTVFVPWGSTVTTTV